MEVTVITANGKTITQEINKLEDCYRFSGLILQSVSVPRSLGWDIAQYLKARLRTTDPTQDLVFIQRGE
jgi:hypothetical protein